jgi:hypothetical protein
MEGIGIAACFSATTTVRYAEPRVHEGELSAGGRVDALAREADGKQRMSHSRIVSDAQLALLAK